MISYKKIQELGLSDKEAKVYLALLELGEATAQQLAIKSGINRATTYVMLDTLQSKGFISTVDKDKKTFFIAEDPFSVVKNLEDEQKYLEERMGKAKKLVPELQMVYNLSRSKSKVRLFEGKESLRIIQNEALKSKSREFYEIFNLNLALEHFPVSENDHRQDFRKKGFKEKIIMIYDPKKPVPDLPPLSKNVERRYLPYDKYPMTTDIGIYTEDKIAIISMKDNVVGVTIENKEIRDSLKVMFDMIWEISKNYKLELGKSTEKK